LESVESERMSKIIQRLIKLRVEYWGLHFSPLCMFNCLVELIRRSRLFTGAENAEHYELIGRL